MESADILAIPTMTKYGQHMAQDILIVWMYTEKTMNLKRAGT
jgi:hypothetical protein